MKNPDLENQKFMEQQEKIRTAIAGEDPEAMTKAMFEFAETIQQNILAEARKAAQEDFSDSQVMLKRGVNPLTEEETRYYKAVIGAGGFAGVEELAPKTIIDRVFEDLEQNYPLLKEIDFVNVTGITEWITRNSNAAGAWWGKLCEPIKKELEGSFSVIQTNLFKLSAFIPVCRAMLDLGPSWLDRYIRVLLAESISIGVEEAIISGTGNDMPIGMMKDLDGAVVGGVYPDKTAVVLDDLSPKSLGSKVMAPLTDNGKRKVPKVLMVVNPLDYWEKIFPETTYLTQGGSYVYGVLPIPATIVQSTAVPQGKMVGGIAKNYFMGVGSSQKVEVSTEYKFLEDEATYLTKQYANGQPKDNSSFIVFDISGLAS